MTDQLAARRALVKRATAAGISNAMKMKSVELERLLGESSMTEQTSNPTDAPVSRETDSTPNADPEAPYGRKADGTPKARPGRKPADGSAPRQTAPKPGRKAPATRARASAAPDYRPGIVGLCQIPAAGMAMAGRIKPVWGYNAATVIAYAPPFADALNDIAQEEPRFAALLDKVLTFGPYGALLGVVLSAGAQFAVNHKRIPVEVGQAFGAVEPDKLMESVAPTA